MMLDHKYDDHEIAEVFEIELRYAWGVWVNIKKLHVSRAKLIQD